MKRDQRGGYGVVMWLIVVARGHVTQNNQTGQQQELDFRPFDFYGEFENRRK